MYFRPYPNAKDYLFRPYPKTIYFVPTQSMLLQWQSKVVPVVSLLPHLLYIYLNVVELVLVLNYFMLTYL
jgi:hypothetical protein